MRVIVVGGGINGLLVSRRLVLEGVSVQLLERGEPGQESSWAGGGIVSPLYPWRYAEPVTALASHAQQAYPALVAALRDETGIDSELERCGLLFVNTPDAERALAWAAGRQMPVQTLTRGELHAGWSGLAADADTGLFFPTLAHVRNPRLLQALQAMLGRHPLAQVLTDAEVEAVLPAAAGHAAGVRLRSGQLLHADAVVVCAGAWTAQLLAGAGVTLPIRPVRGQMQLYKTAPGSLPGMILRDGHYLIPRRDGHVLCGSTLEDAGFDKHTTEVAGQELAAAVRAIWPALAKQPLLRQWAGLRPFAPNGVPFIGPLPGQQGIWINAGQFRNGLVLAPASAEVLTDQLLGRQGRIDPAPYQPGRASQSPEG